MPNNFGEIILLKNSKLYKERTWAHFWARFCHTVISQFLMADIPFVIGCKELQITEIAQINHIFLNF